MGKTNQVNSMHENALSLFFYLLFLTGFFLLLEISFFIRCNRVYFADFIFVSDKLHIPITILPGVIYFITAELLVHLTFCLFTWVITLLVTNFLHITANKKMTVAVAIWLFCLLSAFVFNQYYYPNSKFAELSATILINSAVLNASLFISILGLIILCVVCALQLVKVLLSNINIRSIGIVSVIGLSAALGLIFLKEMQPSPKDAATNEKPNVILVGVDSLRPDFVSYFGAEKSTPFFDSFLNQATVFSEAVTPLARTFPSWTSILTGEYPRQIGVRFNLAAQHRINFESSLPAILHRNGYETIYATDETRFSNIDKNIGFDRIVTPPMGLNDFLLGSFNDFPISNLLINTWVGKWLFPYSYGNRPVNFAYDPDSFLAMVKPVLATPRNKPLFLTIHFCLPHYPYTWSRLPGDQYGGQERYEASVGRVDEQVGDFFALLKQYHLLDHAIVVLLSDHGEGLELSGDRITEKDAFAKGGKTIPQFYPPSLDDEAINQSAGHGTDVLGLPQYHTLLAFKLFGGVPLQQRNLPGVVSVIDIKPTLLDLLGLYEASTTHPYEGYSLAPFVRGQRDKIANNTHIFLESDYTPQAIRTVYPETQKVLQEGIQLFQIDPKTTRLTVKDSMGEMIINSKQYADIYGEWMLALYPQNKSYRMPILINLVSGEWTNDLHSSFALHSPAKTMLQALKNFYGNEIKD